MPSALPTLAPAPPPPDDRRAALALSLAPGVGPVRWRALLARHAGRSNDALHDAVRDAAARSATLDAADRALDRAAAHGLALAMPGESAYPPPLLDLPDPPPALWSLGDPAAPTNAPAVAVVGTRAPSAYGTRCARALAAALARAGAVVVSGMARGIDAEAHLAALDAGGRSVAVLGTGADVPYPRRHRPLYARLAGNGGVVAEAPPGSPPAAGAFPRRNRIIAALARLTVVVEAGARSGALITAGCAADLGRPVTAVPGPIDHPAAAGTNALLRDGAHVLTDVADVLTLAGFLEPLPTAAANAPPSLAAPPPGLGADERALWLALAHPAPAADVLVERTGLPVSRCVAALTTLELAGLVEARWSGELVRR